MQNSLRRVRIGRRLEHAGRADDQRRAFGGVDRRHRAALLADLEDVVLVAVGHHRALAERQPLRRIGRGLHLHDVLLGELLEEAPAEIALHLVGRGHDGAAVARMRLDDLALPFRIEQIGEALRRFFLFHQVGVVGDDADPDAEAGEHAIRVLVLGRIELGDVLGHDRPRACPCFFQTMKCAASDELATSTAWMLLPYSWPMRWNTRSAPVRSTRTAMPGNFASNDLAIFSASGRSTEVYQTTLPSFFAASISAGVIALAGGAADSTAVENALPAAERARSDQHVAA